MKVTRDWTLSVALLPNWSINQGIYEGESSLDTFYSTTT